MVFISLDPCDAVLSILQHNVEQSRLAVGDVAVDLLYLCTQSILQFGNSGVLVLQLRGNGTQFLRECLEFQSGGSQGDVLLHIGHGDGIAAVAVVPDGQLVFGAAGAGGSQAVNAVDLQLCQIFTAVGGHSEGHGAPVTDLIGGAVVRRRLDDVADGVAYAVVRDGAHGRRSLKLHGD